MEYKSLPGSNKNLPRICFAKKNKDFYQPSDNILKIRQNKTYKNDNSFRKEDCWELIEFYKDCIKKNPDWSTFDFKFSPTTSYKNINQFFSEVDNQGYKVWFRNISEDYINNLVNEGKLYLFQIYNKDFSPYSKGKPNLHTMYWKAIFSEENLIHPVYRLNGEAEMFYRKKSIPNDERIIHEKNQPILKKLAEEKGADDTSVFSYDIIKDRRYTVDKFQFHVPVTMNFSAESSVKINDMVMDTIRENDDIHVIGIDRGERNLLYLSLIDKDGRIVEQRSLNVITGDNGYERDYHQLLDKREKEMKKAREDWASINSIKELKEGYLSQAIHIITRWMADYGAIIVLEDLNFGFKNGRKKVDKQVYQKFEKMLIDKLNYYVDKDKNPSENGGINHAYQLTSPFESFQKLGKQTGFLFYIPAWNTSMIDPTTGFVNLFNTKYTSIDETRRFINSFDSISFNSNEGYYEFECDYSKFTARVHGPIKKWTLCSYGERVVTFRNPDKNNEWDSKEIRVTEELNNLFSQYGIDSNSSDIQKEMCGVTDKEFYEKFLRAFKHVVQLRNSVTGTDIDYMVSPVKNKAGVFFDTRIGNAVWPADADANGAYNIARKGLWIMEKIRATKSGEKVKLAMTNAEWLNYAQKNVLY